MFLCRRIRRGYFKKTPKGHIIIKGVISKRILIAKGLKIELFHQPPRRCSPAVYSTAGDITLELTKIGYVLLTFFRWHLVLSLFGINPSIIIGCFFTLTFSY